MSSSGKYSQSRSRGSSPYAKDSTTRRPKLMRAAATAPSLATSNALRKDLSNQQSTRAASILSRVASYSTSQQVSPNSSCSSPSSHRTQSMTARKEPLVMTSHQSESYFSFPSFEDFQDFQEEQLRREEQIHRGEKG